MATAMKDVENTQECFVRLWRKLERTRRLLGGQYKRFCIRNVLKAWFGYEATDDFIWEVCHLSEQEGWNELQAPVTSVSRRGGTNCKPPRSIR